MEALGQRGRPGHLRVVDQRGYGQPARRVVLRDAIWRAVRHGLIGYNVARAELVSAPDGTRKKARWFDWEQVEALIAAAESDPWWNAYVHVAILNGLRPGELLGLRWADMDMDPPSPKPRGWTPTIRTLVSLKAGGLADLKTERSRRRQPLPKRSVAALREHRKHQAAQRLRLGAAWQDNDLVFPGADGRPFNRYSTADGFAALRYRAGLGYGWSRYATRHTFCTLLSHQGVPVEQIADAMGHSNTGVTQKVYKHALEDQVSGAASVFDRAWQA
jgi:integrase